MTNPFLRIIIIAVSLSYICWRLWRRWKGASDYANNELEESKIWKEGFLKFQHDPLFTTIKNYINNKYQATFDKPLDDTTYQIVYAVLLNEKGQVLHFNNESTATNLCVFLKGKKGKVQFTMNLNSKEISEQNSNMFYSGYVPYWAER